MTRTRLAATAALTMTGGAATTVAALVAVPGSFWQGYISEAGASGQPYATPYRWGLIFVAVGVAALAQALRPGPREPTGPREHTGRLGHAASVAAACLAAAAVLGSVSAVVQCSHLCPLPPFEPTTVADVVHACASILGVMALAGAMAAVSLADLPTATRRLAAAAVALTVPLGAAMGLTMLLVGRGPLGAVLERLLLAVAVGWLVGTAVLAGRGVNQRR